MVISALKTTLTQLHAVLSSLSNEDYQRKLPILSHASIGQHTRHIIEFFQAVVRSNESGIVNYDLRLRDHRLETSLSCALQEISFILNSFSLRDRELCVEGSYADGPETFTVKSSYHRELVYNLEHMIHHMAMIKIAIHQSTEVVVPVDFGVASATIQHRKTIL